MFEKMTPLSDTSPYDWFDKLVGVLDYAESLLIVGSFFGSRGTEGTRTQFIQSEQIVAKN